MRRGACKQWLGRAVVWVGSGVMLLPAGASAQALGPGQSPGSWASPFGAYPCAGLLWSSYGALYGTARSGGNGNGGAVFQLNPDGAGFALLHSFLADGQDGWCPSAALAQGGDGTIYGTTAYGGGGGCGAMFKFNANGTGYTVLHSFSGTEGDGAYPMASLALGRDGVFYGTTYSGGNVGAGTVFKLNADGTGYTVLHSFSVAEGAWPCAALVYGWDGALYGTTYSGGSSNLGTVFKMNTDGTGYTVLHSFVGSGVDGAYPLSPLVQGWDGVLYGTTSSGGNNAGTLFRLNADGTGYALLHQFSRDGADGTYPYGSLIQGWDWRLYGTTLRGGSEDAGTVFRLNSDGTGYALLHQFSRDGVDGTYPYSALVQGWDGGLYGTTIKGGGDNAGTVFRLNADGSGYTVLCAFVINGDNNEAANWIGMAPP